MTEWLFKIIAAAFLLTILLLLIPDGNIKKTVTMAFGFIFLIVLVSPLKSMFEDGINKLTGSKIETNMALSDLLGEIPAGSEYDTYTDTVLNEYEIRLQNETNKALEILGFDCNTIITVNRDLNSEKLGRVITVYCVAGKQQTKQQTNSSIVKPIDQIDKIIIDTEGIGKHNPSDAKDDKNKTEQQKKDEKVIRQAIYVVLGVEEKDITIEWL